MVLGHHTEKHHPDDDIEANAGGFAGNSYGNSPEPKDLDEYEKLDRFITTFDAGGGHQAEIEEEKEVVPWWKIWKSTDDANVDFDGKPPAAWLETDIHHGITSNEVVERRRRFGWNELTAEKENQFRKFLSFFQGPILYGKFVATASTMLWPVLFYADD